MTARPLDGVRIVSFGQYFAGPLLAALLGEQGASVVHVDPPGGPRWKAGAQWLRHPDDFVIEVDLTTATGRQEANDLVTSTDVVIENFRPDVMANFGVDYDTLKTTNTQLIYCSLPGFGRTDPRASVPGWEGVVLAAAGAFSTDVSTQLIPDDRAPGRPFAFSGLPLGSVFAAMEGSIAVTSALIVRDRDGVGQEIEVSLFDSLAEAVGVRSCTYERNPPRNTDFGHGIFRCKDGGLVNLVLVQFRHVQWCSDAIAPRLREQGLVDYARIVADPECGKRIRQVLIETFATDTAEHWEKRGQEAGLAIGRVRSLHEWMSTPLRGGSPGGLSRGVANFLGALTLDNGPASKLEVLTAPDVDAPTTGRTADATLPALSGVRVLDMSRVIAGPTVARVLAQYGADVLSIDNDPALRHSSLSEPVWHEFFNRGKRSALVDLTTAAGAAAFHSLIREADVVVQNSPPEILARHGADPESLQLRAPHLNVVSLTTYGQSAEYLTFRGYAEIANAVTGVSYRSISDDLVSGSLPTVDRPRWTFTDTAAGLLGAFGAVLALLHRSRHGTSSVSRPTLTGAALLTQLPYVVQLIADADAEWHEPQGEPPLGWDAFQRIYECADGTLFIGVGEKHVQDVTLSLGFDLNDTSSLESRLERALATRHVGDVCSLVINAGGGAHRLMSTSELCCPGGDFDLRGLWLESDTENHGRISMLGPVVRMGYTPLVAGTIPTPFGSDQPKFLSRTERDPKYSRTS